VVQAKAATIESSGSPSRRLLHGEVVGSTSQKEGGIGLRRAGVVEGIGKERRGSVVFTRSVGGRE
jgi:hypothetical protein